MEYGPVITVFPRCSVLLQAVRLLQVVGLVQYVQDLESADYGKLIAPGRLMIALNALSGTVQGSRGGGSTFSFKKMELPFVAMVRIFAWVLCVLHVRWFCFALWRH